MKKLLKRIFGKFFCVHRHTVQQYRAKGKYKNVKKGSCIPKWRYDVYETVVCSCCGKEMHYWKVRSNLTETQAKQFINQTHDNKYGKI